MALIKCSECGRDISDKAASCPFCGCPIQAKDRYTLTYNIQSSGALAAAMHNTTVSSSIERMTKQIQDKGGTVINIENGRITNLGIMTMQTIVFIYEAKTKLYKNSCDMKVQVQGFKPRATLNWHD